MTEPYENIVGKTPDPEKIKSQFVEDALEFINQLGGANPTQSNWTEENVVGDPVVTTVRDEEFGLSKPAKMLFLRKPFNPEYPEEVCNMLCVFIGGYNPAKMIVLSDIYKRVSLWLPSRDGDNEYWYGSNVGRDFTKNFLKDTKGKKVKPEDLESYILRIRGLYNHYNLQINRRASEI
jgi:hypothetical protein